MSIIIKYVNILKVSTVESEHNLTAVNDLYYFFPSSEDRWDVHFQCLLIKSLKGPSVWEYCILNGPENCAFIYTRASKIDFHHLTSQHTTGKLNAILSALETECLTYYVLISNMLK